MQTLTCDVAIVGGSLGGLAASLHLQGLKVVWIGETNWFGGQISAQGVSALDEHLYIESFGGTQTYNQLRAAIREHYQQQFDAPVRMADSMLGPDMPLNPGNGWVSRLCFLPEIGARLAEELSAHTVKFRESQILDAERSNDRVKAVIIADQNGIRTRIEAAYFLDATDLGELFPLVDAPYVTGAECVEDTGESTAPAIAKPNETQGFTYCFAVEYCPGEDHTIEQPEGYETFRVKQPYTLSPIGRDGQPVVYKMFTSSEQGNLPFWTYRRIHDGTLLGGRDIALINWVSNDYHDGNIIDVSAELRSRYLQEARQLSLGFLYWLQTECPRDDGGYGYPEFRLRPDVMGTADGLSQMPYIRESRRLRGLSRVVVNDVDADVNSGARARHFFDSVGLGWYALDLHPCVGNPEASLYAPTRPFQIPLGALFATRPHNLIAACKNISTTHLTNGAYRVHPVEWNVGEVAGLLARFSLENKISPQGVYRDERLLWRFQMRCAAAGIPLVWANDVTQLHPLWFATQVLLVRDIIREGSERWHSLKIEPARPLGDDFELQKLREIAEQLNEWSASDDISGADIQPSLSWEGLCNLFDEALRCEYKRQMSQP